MARGGARRDRAPRPRRRVRQRRRHARAPTASTRAASSPSCASARTSTATAAASRSGSRRSRTARCASSPPSSAGRRRDRAVLDAGSKTLTSDTLPGLEAGTYGLVVEYPDAVDPPALRGARRRRSLRVRPHPRDRRRGHDRPEPRLRHGQHARRARAAPRRRPTSRSFAWRPRPRALTVTSGRTSRLQQASEREQRVVVPVGDALLQRDDRVVGDLDPLRADLGAALRDVAEPMPASSFTSVGAVGGVERVHLERGDADEEARAEVAVCSSWSRRTWQTSWQRKHSMHLRNSCMRSTSSCCMRQSASGSA